MTLQFDPNFPGLFEGEITKVAVIDPVSAANQVLDPTLPINVQIEWRIFGTQVPIYLAGAVPDWAVSAYAEAVGPGSANVRLGTVAVPKTSGISCGPDCLSYKATVTALPGVLQEHNPEPPVPPFIHRSGIYRVMAAVFLNSTIPGHDLIGFREGPVIQVEGPS